MPMRCAPDQAVNEHKLPHGPLDRLDPLFGHAIAIAQQSDVRREWACLARAAVERVAQALLQDFETDHTIVAAQNEDPVLEALRPVETDTEGRHHDARDAFLHGL